MFQSKTLGVKLNTISVLTGNLVIQIQNHSELFITFYYYTTLGLYKFPQLLFTVNSTIVIQFINIEKR